MKRDRTVWWVLGLILGGTLLGLAGGSRLRAQHKKDPRVGAKSKRAAGR